MNTAEFKEVRSELEAYTEQLSKSKLSNLEDNEIFRILEEVFELGYSSATVDAKRGNLL